MAIMDDDRANTYSHMSEWTRRTGLSKLRFHDLVKRNLKKNLFSTSSGTNLPTTDRPGGTPAVWTERAVVIAIVTDIETFCRNA